MATIVIQFGLFPAGKSEQDLCTLPKQKFTFMKRMALNFICKNEAHVISNMLTSVRPIADLIVAVDTGSTDDTVKLIEQFGTQNNIPTYVSARPFDNFSNSRNFALDELLKTVECLGWNLEETWGFWIDCDEHIVFSSKFEKNKIDQDLYLAKTWADSDSYSKQLFFRLSKGFRWVGPIHEIMEWADDVQIKIDVVKGINIIYERTGASWKGDLVEKFLDYARILEDYVNNGNNNFRWTFVIGDSYQAAAEFCKDSTKRTHILRSAKQSYEIAFSLCCTRSDQYICLYKIAEVKTKLNYDWQNIEKVLLKAHEMDPSRAECINRIIEHYIETNDWLGTYKYTDYAVNSFHGKSPVGLSHFCLDGSLYEWRLLYFHYLACQHCNRKKDASVAFKQLKYILQYPNEYLKEKDRLKILATSPLILNLRSMFSNIVNPIRRAFAKTIPSLNSTFNH